MAQAEGRELAVSAGGVALQRGAGDVRLFNGGIGAHGDYGALPFCDVGVITSLLSR